MSDVGQQTIDLQRVRNSTSRVTRIGSCLSGKRVLSLGKRLSENLLKGSYLSFILNHGESKIAENINNLMKELREKKKELLKRRDLLDSMIGADSERARLKASLSLKMAKEKTKLKMTMKLKRSGSDLEKGWSRSVPGMALIFSDF